MSSLDALRAYWKVNLPPVDFTCRQRGNKLWVLDIVRKKYIALTPEEWVRQHIIHYLITQKGYPKSLFSVERGLHYNRLQKRADVVVHDRNGRAWMIIECKSPLIKITQQAFNQAALYNMSVRAQYIVVTNGKMHFCVDTQSTEAAANFRKDIPDFPEELNDM